ncbi:MAG: hypothetical protein ACI9DQ_001420 [Glaciecola sp.]|jgi:hypothetical protein
MIYISSNRAISSDELCCIAQFTLFLYKNSLNSFKICNAELQASTILINIEKHLIVI